MNSPPQQSPPEKSPTISANQALVGAHHQLHTHNQALKKQIIFLMLLSGVLSLILGILVWAFLYHYPKYRYVVTTDNKVICQLATLDKPSITAAALENFVQEAVLEVYRYDYINFEQQTQQALNRFFTFNGRAGYYQSLANSGNLEKVKSNKLIAKAQAIRSAQIESEQVVFGQYTWKIAIPIKIEFYIGKSDVLEASTSSQTFLALVTVVQETPTKINPKGVAIDAIVLKPM